MIQHRQTQTITIEQYSKIIKYTRQQNMESDESFLDKQFIQTIRKYSYLWEYLRLTILTYYIIQAPLVISFQSYYRLINSQMLPVSIIIFLLMVLDFGFKIIETERPSRRSKKKTLLKLVGLHYLIRKYLILDLIVLLCLFTTFFIPFTVHNYLKFFVLLRYKDLTKFNDRMYLKVCRTPMLKVIYTMIKIFYVVTIFCHYYGCGFYLIDQIAINDQWYGSLQENPTKYYQGALLCFTPIQALSDPNRYLYALYFSVSLITTIAFGDIVGRNPPQQIYILFGMIFSTIGLAIIFQQIIGIINSSFGTYEFTQKFNCLKSFMDFHNVGFKIQNKVRCYLTHVQYDKKNYQQDPVIDKLTPQMKNQIYYEGYGKMLTKSFSILIQNQYTIYNLSNVLIQKTANFQIPLFQLYSQSTQLNISYIYIVNGSTQMYVQYDQKSSKIPIGSKKQYNFYQLMTNTKSRYGVVVSEQFASYIQLSKSDFNQILFKQNLEVKAKFISQSMKCEQISQDSIGQMCLVCQINGHKIINCPRLHLVKGNPDFIGLPEEEKQCKNNIISLQQSFNSSSRKNMRQFQKRLHLTSKKKVQNKKKQKNIFAFLDKFRITNPMNINDSVNPFQLLFQQFMQVKKHNTNEDSINSQHVDSTYDPNFCIKNYYTLDHKMEQ